MTERAEPTGPEVLDLFVIGGGINGCGIARDAAGRGPVSYTHLTLPTIYSV